MGLKKKMKKLEKRITAPKLEELQTLDPLSEKIMSQQPTITIGLVGHVAHGKSTVVKALSGVKTSRFKCELERNITIRLGYANCKIYKCEECPAPECYRAYGGDMVDDPKCDVPGFEHCKMKLVRHVSFVDCPGHEVLMSTMISGSGCVDGALLVVAANEPFPQPQTLEHLLVLEILQQKNIVILQNKVDLLVRGEQEARDQQQAILENLKGTVACNSPVIPICAQLNINMDVVSQYLVNRIPVPQRDLVSPLRMTLIRSFDVNRPGSGIDQLRGGVVGGSITRGVLKVNQIIELRPGAFAKDVDGNFKCNPIFARVTSLSSGNNQLQFAVPGGLIGVGTTMDPALSRGDRLVGQVLGDVGTLPDVYSEIKIGDMAVSRHVIGIKDDGTCGGGGGGGKVSKLVKGETLLLNVSSTAVGGEVIEAKTKSSVKLKLNAPVCTNLGDKVTLSRRVSGHWRVIARGLVCGGTTIQLPRAPF